MRQIVVAYATAEVGCAGLSQWQTKLPRLAHVLRDDNGAAVRVQLQNVDLELFAGQPLNLSLVSTTFGGVVRLIPLMRPKGSSPLSP
jgi:hypothetical protein